MTPKPSPPLDATGRAQMKQWLDNWKRLGPILAAERWARLAAMTEGETQQATTDLLDLWQPDWTGDGGEELLLHQRVFSLGRSARSAQ